MFAFCLRMFYKRLLSSQLLCLAILSFQRMCRGLEEEKLGGLCRLQSTHLDAEDTPRATATTVPCELCGSRASLYCQADDAFLCRKCDKCVHGANFLALRHIRCFLCNTCQNLTQRYLLGASFEVVLPTIVSLSEGSDHCNSAIGKQCSRKLKMPFLLL
ncbi:hypothetical protein I3760_03G156900 [Carya illinoinensis]|nr:hypothetical protein I3760_03G156900 [Carya illinoinensis]